MKKSVSVFLTGCIIADAACAGTGSYPGKEMKEAVTQATPCPEWYRDTEWNVSLWGTYAWAGNNGHADIGNSFNFNRQFAEFNLSEFFFERPLPGDRSCLGRRCRSEIFLPSLL